MSAAAWTNFIKLQNFVGHYLSSYNALDSVNIVTRFQLLQNESKLPDKTLALEVLAYITPRNGRKGMGIIIEPPEFQVNAPNLPGPEGFIVVPILVISEKMLNETLATGCNLPADQCCQMIMDALHWQQFEGFGQLFCDTQAMVRAQDFDPLDAWRLRFKLRMPRGQTEKVAQPTITEDAGTITLACTTADAQIYYTLDESYPGRSNSGAIVYEAPFIAEAGDIINVAAYKDGLTPSHMIQATVTA